MLQLIILDLDETLLRLPVGWDNVKKEIIEFGKKEKVQFNPNAHIIPLSSQISNTGARKEMVDSIWRKHELETLEKKGIERYPKAEEFVKKMKSKGLKLAIASNNTHDAIEQALILAGIREYIDKIEGRDNTMHTKPAPDLLLKLAWKYKLHKDEIVFIGDSENDKKAGLAAGIKTILVKPGSDFPKLESNAQD